MKEFCSLGLRIKNRSILILDQRKLPHEEIWIDATEPAIMIDCIRSLAVRGAPLIGVSAALSLGKFSETAPNWDAFIASAKAVREARPTAVNLMAAVDRVALGFTAIPPKDWKDQVKEIADQILEEDVRLSECMAEAGTAIIPDECRVLTHCNTGGLATAGIGTALGVIRRAHEKGKKIFVWVDETRPLLQGGRLTAWELERLGIPYKIITDSMSGFLMSRGEVDLAITGADRIAKNGDTANKIGTHTVAGLCHLYEIPFYIAAPVTTFDFQCPSGAEIPIEERPENEVRGFGKVQWAPASAKAWNPSFDVTPAKWIHGWITDRGIWKNSTEFLASG